MFVIVSRLPEMLTNMLGINPKLALLLSLASSGFAVASGRLGETFRNPAGLAILAYTTWYMLCIPFSLWPGGSVMLMREQWVFSVLAFFVLSCMPVSSAGLNRYAGAIAWAAIVVNLIMLHYGTERGSRGSLTFDSSLSNPNIASLQLLLGLPFLTYWTRTRGFFDFRGVTGLVSAAVLAFLIVTRSGSRSGLIILVVCTLMLLSDTKVHIKGMLLVVVVAAGAVSIQFVPTYLLYRYSTVLSGDSDDGSEATASTRERRQLLEQSLALTLQHPLLGVGGGGFKIAEAALSELSGTRAAWLETHNMYTQLSSETGVPGLVIYLSMIGFSMFPVWKDLRRSKRIRKRLPRHEFARALLIAAFGLSINSCFTSVAYEYYWPIFCALGVAYQRVAAIEDAADAAPAPPVSAGPPQMMTKVRLRPRPAY